MPNRPPGTPGRGVTDESTTSRIAAEVDCLWRHLDRIAGLIADDAASGVTVHGRFVSAHMRVRSGLQELMDFLADESSAACERHALRVCNVRPMDEHFAPGEEDYLTTLLSETPVSTD